MQQLYLDKYTFVRVKEVLFPAAEIFFGEKKLKVSISMLSVCSFLHQSLPKCPNLTHYPWIITFYVNILISHRIIKQITVCVI